MAPPFGSRPGCRESFCSLFEQRQGPSRCNREASISKSRAEKMLVVLVVDVLDASLSIDYVVRLGHDVLCHRSVRVEKDHLLVNALIVAQQPSCLIALLGGWRAMDIVGQSERIKGFCEALFHAVAMDINRRKRPIVEPQTLEFPSDPTVFGVVAKHPGRSSEMSKGVEVLEGSGDQSNRRKHHCLDGRVVDL